MGIYGNLWEEMAKNGNNGVIYSGCVYHIKQNKNKKTATELNLNEWFYIFNIVLSFSLNTAVTS